MNDKCHYCGRNSAFNGFICVTCRNKAFTSTPHLQLKPRLSIASRFSVRVPLYSGMVITTGRYQEVSEIPEWDARIGGTWVEDKGRAYLVCPNLHCRTIIACGHVWFKSARGMNLGCNICPRCQMHHYVTVKLAPKKKSLPRKKRRVT